MNENIWQIETIRQQCLALSNMRIDATFINNKNNINEVFVKIRANEKEYRFSDADLKIIISQISTLSELIKINNRMIK